MNKKVATKSRRKTKSKKVRAWKQRWLVALAVIVGSIGLVFGIFEVGQMMGFWGESGIVKQLKRDPLASLELPGLKLVHAEQKWNNDGRYKTPQYVARWFEPADGQTFGQAMADLIKYAEGQGWEYEDLSVRINYWFARKPNHQIIRIRIVDLDTSGNYTLYKSDRQLLLVELE